MRGCRWWIVQLSGSLDAVADFDILSICSDQCEGRGMASDSLYGSHRVAELTAIRIHIYSYRILLFCHNRCCKDYISQTSTTVIIKTKSLATSIGTRKLKGAFYLLS